MGGGEQSARSDDPYAVSEPCAELIIANDVSSYLSSSAVAVGLARAGNLVFGADLKSSSRTLRGGRIFVDCCDGITASEQPEFLTPSARTHRDSTPSHNYMILMAQLDREDVTGEAFNFGATEQTGLSNGYVAKGSANSRVTESPVDATARE